MSESENASPMPGRRLGRKRQEHTDPVRLIRSRYDARTYAVRWLARDNNKFAEVISAIRAKESRADILALPMLRNHPEALAWLEAHLPEDLPAALQLDDEARKARSRRARYNTLRRDVLNKVKGLHSLARRRDLEDLFAALEARATKPEIMAMHLVTSNALLAQWLLEHLPDEPAP